MKMRSLVLILAVLLSASLYARPSEAGVIFLTINPGARSTGMGDSFVAIADDATATYWNPAGLGFQDGSGATFMHVNWLPGFKIGDMSYEFFAYKHYIEDVGTIGGNITYFYLGEMKRTSETNEDLGTFKTYETEATLSYGTLLMENLAVGINAKFIYSHLSDQGAGSEKGSGTGHSVAIDLGVLYRSNYDVDFGLSISNMGPKISYIDYEQADPLPTNMKLGFAYYMLNDELNTFVITGDMNKLLVKKGKVIDGEGEDNKIDTSDEWNHTDPIYQAIFTSWTDDDGVKDVIWGLGAEYWYDDMIGLRGGFWNDDMGKISASTYGATIRYGLYSFDFSYLDAGEGHPLTDTMRFSVNVDF